MSPDPGPVRREVEIYSSLLPLDGARIVELGCGAAEHTIAIAIAHPTATLVGFEVDRVQHAKNLSAPRPTNVRFEEGGAQAIPAADASADVVLMFKSLHHVPAADMDRAFDEIARVLVPAGLVYVSEPVWQGDLNEITKIYNDEEHVRARAFDAMRGAIDRGLFELVDERFFQAERRYGGVDDFVDRMIGASYRDDRVTPEQLAEIRRRVAAHVRPDGVRLLQPMRIDLLRKVARGPAH